MLDWMGWDYGTVIASVVGFFAAGLFVVRYLIEAGRQAWENPFGRFLLTRKSLLMALFGFILINRMFGGIERPDAWPGQDLMAFIIFGAFAIQTFVPYRLLLNAQKAHIKHEEEAHGTE